MNEDEGKKDIVLIAWFVLGAIGVGLLAVLIYLAIKQEGGFLPIVWSLAFLICGGGLGFLFGIPRILSDNTVPEPPSPSGVTPTSNTAATQTTNLRSNYRPSTHLERISEWLTTLIVGLTLVQWKYVVDGFNSIALFISIGLNPAAPVSNLSFAASIMLYFSVTGFLGAYLLTRIYLSRIFEKTDVGIGLKIDPSDRLDLIKNADLSNPRNLALNPNLGSVARKILDYRLEQLTSLEDIIAWSKAQLAARNFENAVAGYEKAVEIAPTDIQLRLEFANALYYAGEATSDPVRKNLLRAKNEEQLLKAYGLLNLSTNAELRMKVYRAITYFYLFSDLSRKDFDKTIKFGEEYVSDPSPGKITSVGILVNLASAYGQRYKWLLENNGSQIEKAAARLKALEYIQKTLDLDINGGWLNRLQTLLRSDIQKDPSDDDLEVFENDNDFRTLLRLPLIAADDGSNEGGDEQKPDEYTQADDAQAGGTQTTDDAQTTDGNQTTDETAED